MSEPHSTDGSPRVTAKVFRGHSMRTHAEYLRVAVCLRVRPSIGVGRVPVTAGSSCTLNEDIRGNQSQCMYGKHKGAEWHLRTSPRSQCLEWLIMLMCATELD